MASKKYRPLDDPPAASSSEEMETEEEEEEEEEDEEQKEDVSKPKSREMEEREESEDSDEDEEGSDNDEDEDQEKKKKKKTANLKPSPAKLTKKNSLPESSSESDSQKSPRTSDFTIKHISPADDAEKPATPISKLSAAKRGAEIGKSASRTKKLKTEASRGEGEDEENRSAGATTVEKKSVINRLWSEDDEISILRGLLEFQSKLGKDVSTHNQEFHDFVKGSLHVDVTKTQLMDKVRRLKRKFKTHLERSNNGEDPSFPRAHELKCFQLSKKIWGNQSDKNGGINDNNHNEKPSRSSRMVGNEKSKSVASMEKGTSEKIEGKEKTDDFGKLYPYLMSACKPDHMSNLPIPEFLKNNLYLIGSSQLKDWDNKWKKQNVAEMEVYLRRIDLLGEEAHMVLNAMKSNKN